jgi:nucleotide-binding universal stress UspA family protein
MNAPLLVPLDFSECSPVLLDEALRFARAFGAPLLLLHVGAAPRGLSTSTVIQAENGQRSRTVGEALESEAREHLGPLADAARRAGITVETRVELGPIADRVLAVAQESRASMIIMGTHGRRGLVRVALGSIAEEVLRRAEVPVVTVRTKHTATCAASSCATCSGDRTDLDRALGAETQG